MKQVILNIQALRKEMLEVNILTFKKLSELTWITQVAFSKMNKKDKQWKEILVQKKTCDKIIEQIILLSKEKPTHEELFEKIFKNKTIWKS